MAQITAALVKELRTKSGAGMMDCKKALVENDCDIEASIDWLRTKGLAAAAKKSSRVAAEGLVGVVAEGKKGALAEINSETDFVARNDQFQAIVRNITAIALENNGDMAAVQKAGYPGTERNVEEEVVNAVATIGENMNLRRTTGLSVENGVVASYVHNAVVAGLGKIGVLVALESTGDAAKLEALGKQLAMHIAATAPASMDTDDLDQELVQRERDVLIEQARESGKPDNIIEKMIEGRMRKYYEEVCLMKQTFAIDGETKIEKVVENAAKDLGTPVKLAAYVRFQIGEGIEKEEGDFAAEVKAAAGV
ncbi:MAG: elongation factor Ts [Sphingomonadales bacterium]|nr:elongation factor Ts [Sphingomonadales bacterium]